MKEVTKMTKALKAKAIKAIEECRVENPHQLVDWGFHHYGHDYRIVECSYYKAGWEDRAKYNDIFDVYRVNPYSILNTHIGTIDLRFQPTQTKKGGR